MKTNRVEVRPLFFRKAFSNDRQGPKEPIVGGISSAAIVQELFQPCVDLFCECCNVATLQLAEDGTHEDRVSLELFFEQVACARVSSVDLKIEFVYNLGGVFPQFFSPQSAKT
ncbi:MAG: hypothetical protein MI923_05045, partial [Phycisphaerales bacterium]|nr:hypothetical protein [Phycisphaerales bacterium]